MSTQNYSKELVQFMKEKGLIVYVFTENNEEKANEMLKNGVDVVGTDFLI